MIQIYFQNIYAFLLSIVTHPEMPVNRQNQINTLCISVLDSRYNFLK